MKITELRDTVRGLLAYETDIQNMTNMWVLGVAKAWLDHKATKGKSADWERVWQEERAKHAGVQLSSEARDLIVKALKKDCDDISHRAIAAALGISLGTVNNIAKKDTEATDVDTQDGDQGMSDEQDCSSDPVAEKLAELELFDGQPAVIEAVAALRAIANKRNTQHVLTIAAAIEKLAGQLIEQGIEKLLDEEDEEATEDTEVAA